MIYTVTYNHEVSKPSSYDILMIQKKWSLDIEADTLEAAEQILKTEHNKNPFYFNLIQK